LSAYFPVTSTYFGEHSDSCAKQNDPLTGFKERQQPVGMTIVTRVEHAHPA